jgi:thiosulfate dehydrogenase
MFLERIPSLCLLAATMLAGCGDDKVPAAEFGQDRFSDHKVSTSRFNDFSCATCHVVDPGAPAVVEGRLDPGYNLAGASTRGSWWGGGSTSLLDAINVCVKEFMGGAPLTKDSDTARQLDAYLEQGAPAMNMPAKFSFVRITTPLAELKGDATRGADEYKKACYRCHGEIHNGKGHGSGAATVIPEASISTFGTEARDVTIEKVRHGRFINIGGVMPFYTAEAMSDQTVADILVYMGL